MRQGNDDWPVAEAMADAVLEPPGAEKPGDRQLADRDHDPGLQHVELGVQPVGTVGDSGRRRPQVARTAWVAPGEAPHERGDVRRRSELFGVSEAGADHPAVELLASAAGERTAGFPFELTRRLPDQQESRAPR